jgi:hypothetical protein
MAEDDAVVPVFTPSFVKKTTIQRTIKRTMGLHSLCECQRRMVGSFQHHHRPLPVWNDIDGIICVRLKEQTLTVNVLVPTDHLATCDQWCNSSNEQLLQELQLNAVETAPVQIVHHQEEMLKATLLVSSLS